MLSISEIANSARKIGTDALLIVKNHIFSSIWGNHSAYLIHLHNKNENGNVSSFGTKVCQKFDTFHLLEYYIRSVYCNAH